MTPREILSEYAEQGTMRPEVRKALIAVLGELVEAEAKAERNWRAREALTHLVAQLDLVHADSRYLSVWSLAKVHGQVYTGPFYDEQINYARAVLRDDAGTKP